MSGVDRLQDIEMERKAFVWDAMRASGVVNEDCPHQTPVHTDKPESGAYALATKWFKEGRKGADNFQGLEDLRDEIQAELQTVSIECFRCNEPN